MHTVHTVFEWVAQAVDVAGALVVIRTVIAVFFNKEIEQMHMALSEEGSA